MTHYHPQYETHREIFIFRGHGVNMNFVLEDETQYTTVSALKLSDTWISRTWY